MKLTLRERLGLTVAATDSELRAACDKHALMYRNLIETTTDELVKRLASTKLNDLIKAAEEEGIEIDTAQGIFSNANVINYTSACVEEILSHAKSGELSQSQAKKAYAQLSNLPDTAKKDYLNALIRFMSEPRSTTSISNFSIGVGEASRKDPDNIVYATILQDCQLENEQYKADLDLWVKERIRQIDHDRNVNIFLKILKGIGKALVYVGGGILAVIGGIFACACESADC